MPDQLDSVHMMSIASYSFITQLTGIVTYQFIFFSFSIQQRLDVFMRNFVFDLKLHENCEQNFIRKYSKQYTVLLSVMEKINATFSIQVK